MKPSITIAAYDERDNVETLFSRLIGTLERSFESWEIIFVVAGTDGTKDLLEQLALGEERVRIHYEETPDGLGTAFRQGFSMVSPDADCVVTLDADLNHQPEEIPGLVERLHNPDADIVVGSRLVSGGSSVGTPLWKRFLSETINVVISLRFGLRVRDKTSGFRVYRADTIAGIDFREKGFSFLPEILILASRNGARIVEEPIRFTFRERGESKLLFWRTSWSYVKLFFLKTARP